MSLNKRYDYEPLSGVEMQQFGSEGSGSDDSAATLAEHPRAPRPPPAIRQDSFLHHSLPEPEPYISPARQNTSGTDSQFGRDIKNKARQGVQGVTTALSSLSGAAGSLWGLQTRFTTVSAQVQKKLGHNYRPLKQLRKNAQKLLARWLLNVILSGLVVILFKYYENDGILTQYEKRIFNGLYLGISLFMGMNMVNSLKSMADMMKWSIMAKGRWTAQEINFILDISSYQRACQLLLLWKGKPWRVLAVTNWVALGLGAQIAVAILGLTFNHETEDADFSTVGQVNVTRLDHYYVDNGMNSEPTGWQEDYMSHLYGEMIYASLKSVSIASVAPGQDASWRTYDDIVRAFNRTNINLANSSEFSSTGHTGWRYNYNDWTFSTQDNLGAPTNRTVEVVAKCNRGAIIDGQDGVAEQFTVLHNDGRKEMIDWLSNTGEQGTVYVTNGTCGDRCANIHVYQFISTADLTNPKLSAKDKEGDFFDCKVEVSKVNNAMLDVHFLPDNIARRAAGAIGLSGFAIKAPQGFSFQSVLYNTATTWGQDVSHSPEVMGTIIGLFSIGSLANMDIHNPRTEALGNRLHRGVRLLVVWHYVWITLGIILLGHAVLGILVCSQANKVFCKQDSPLSTARLLRPIVERLGPSGCAASGDEIAASFPMLMTYGVRSNETFTLHHLDIGEDLEPLGKEPFPAGYYD
ncbi:Similar to hypothetical protein [Tuber melanosporum Mel28]; acc. no. XP_002836511 [Pyronema omphalodes CBS 100304]|uniref:Uncharacterized protein n=1 Tax=Pyronema omphalodes (strain CBS 100304) TaxID=1076935 RepID=U4L200_PYROM|nr:Similar to hypothetical protein [Tuber melanosporum Mel28]; acc. no. XP_002836511 [Pyronema omphalodes CBS 100304]